MLLVLRIGNGDGGIVQIVRGDGRIVEFGGLMLVELCGLETMMDELWSLEGLTRCKDYSTCVWSIYKINDERLNNLY